MVIITIGWGDYYDVNDEAGLDVDQALLAVI